MNMKVLLLSVLITGFGTASGAEMGTGKDNPVAVPPEPPTEASDVASYLQEILNQVEHLFDSTSEWI